MRIYIYLAAVVAFASMLFASYTAGKRSVVYKLQSDRIEVLQDGKKIDADVLAADDDSLVCLLINCKTN